MPIYEYRCPSCGSQRELLRKINDKNKPFCLECSSYMEKIVSVSSFHLKGNCWAKDDYGLKQTKGGQ